MSYLIGKSLRRQHDGKMFTIREDGFWMKIASEDGETDTVKWAFNQEFVSASAGHGYVTVGWTI